MAWQYNKNAAPGAAAPAAQAQPAPTTPPAGQHPLAPPTSPLPPTGAVPPSPLPPQQAAPPPASRRASGRRGAKAAAAAAPVEASPAQHPGQQTLLSPTQAAPAAAAAAPVHTPEPFDNNYVPPQPQAQALPPEAARVPIQVPAGGLLGIIASQAPPSDRPSALAGIVEIGERKGGEPNLFPTVYLTGGQQGGGMVKDDMNIEGTDELLPVGIDGFPAVLFGFRFISLLWPVAQNPNLKSRPFSRAVIGSAAPELATTAFEAQRKYQFRNRPPVKYGAEAFYDHQTGGHGHPSLTLEMLVFDVEAGIMGVQTCSTYDSVLDTTRAMNTAFPQGKVQPTPVFIKPHTWQTKGSKAQPGGWPEHGYQVTMNLDQAVWAAWTNFLSVAGMDPELGEALARWGTTTIDAKHQSSLQIIMNA
jgi:hypothetical protein